MPEKTEKTEGNEEETVEKETPLPSEDQTKILAQIKTEYAKAKRYIDPKWAEWAARLKLYNNQRRDKTAIGDPLLFSIFQTTLASLYDDRLQVTFQPREAGDIDVADNLDATAKYDYDAMQKDELDYAWDWDAAFFGRGLCLMIEFDREKMLPQPEVVDPMTWLRDPAATSVNGDNRGRGAMRYGGRYKRMTKIEMKENGNYFNLEKLKPVKGGSAAAIDDTVEATRTARDEAQGRQNVSNMGIIGDNEEYSLVEWFTMFDNKKVLVVMDNDQKFIVRYTVFSSNKEDWPIEDRSFYPMSHDWDGVSIPDLVEDKQRARAILQNLSLDGAKAGVYPMYLYDASRIHNKADIGKFEPNKMIPVDGQVGGAVQPMERQALKSEVQYILQMIDNSAQRATGTPETTQGALSGEAKTATEIATVSQGVDTRYSLSAKIFGWSERRFWRRWYKMYKDFMANDVDEKIIRIAGSSSGYKFRPLLKDNLVAKIDPDIKVESTVVSEAQNLVKLNKMSALFSSLLQEPTANRRYALKKMARLNDLDSEEITLLLPPTVDEMDALDENNLLDKNKTVKLRIDEDHITHIEEHRKAAETNAKMVHIEAHKQAMLMIKRNPELVSPELADRVNQLPNQPIDLENIGSIAKTNLNAPSSLNTASQ